MSFCIWRAHGFAFLSIHPDSVNTGAPCNASKIPSSAATACTEDSGYLASCCQYLSLRTRSS
eukprot:7039825-Pyramimonas_sp.AAC.1